MKEIKKERTEHEMDYKSMTSESLSLFAIQNKEAEHKLSQCPIPEGERRVRMEEHRKKREEAYTELNRRLRAILNVLQGKMFASEHMVIAIVDSSNYGRLDPAFRVTVHQEQKNTFSRNTLSEMDSYRLIKWTHDIQPIFEEAMEIEKLLQAIQNARNY